MILLFDTETTGKPANFKAPVSDLNNWPRLVQIAWQKYNYEGELIEEFDSIVKPEGFIIPRDATQVHGITTEDAIAYGSELPFILAKLNACLSNVEVVVAHNIGFDERIVGAEFIRTKLSDGLSRKRRICTMEGSKNFCEIPGEYGYKWPKLSELHIKLFGCDVDGKHNAKNDLKATARCFWELLRRGVISLPRMVESNREFNRPQKTQQATEKELYNSEIVRLFRDAEDRLNKYVSENNLKLILAHKASALSLLRVNFSKIPHSASINEEFMELVNIWSDKKAVFPLQKHQVDFINKMKQNLISEIVDDSFLSRYDTFDKRSAQIDAMGVIGFDIKDDKVVSLIQNIYRYYLDLYNLHFAESDVLVHKTKESENKNLQRESGQSGCLSMMIFLFLLAIMLLKL